MLTNLLTDVIVKDRTLPAGYDAWAIRSVRPDFRSSRGYRWPFPGQIAAAAGPFSTSHSPCPRYIGDGLCAAYTWAGMASGGIPAITLLLVAYMNDQVLGKDADKVRAKTFMVVDLIDGSQLVTMYGKNADLPGANLTRANLHRANLYGADLYGADLTRADLSGADLHRANLHRADLHSADLHRADLSAANLSGADLRGANLYGANLYGANLSGANLSGANLSRALNVPEGIVA